MLITPAWQVQSGPAGASDRQERSMVKYVISYRAPKDYVSGREDDMAAWAAWFTSIGEDLVDFYRNGWRLISAAIGTSGRTYCIRLFSRLPRAVFSPQPCIPAHRAEQPDHRRRWVRPQA